MLRERQAGAARAGRWQAGAGWGNGRGRWRRRRGGIVDGRRGGVRPLEGCGRAPRSGRRASGGDGRRHFEAEARPGLLHSLGVVAAAMAGLPRRRLCSVCAALETGSCLKLTQGALSGWLPGPASCWKARLLAACMHVHLVYHTPMRQSCLSFTAAAHLAGRRSWLWLQACAHVRARSGGGIAAWLLLPCAAVGQSVGIGERCWD
jgi:hypothetical protein